MPRQHAKYWVIPGWRDVQARRTGDQMLHEAMHAAWPHLQQTQQIPQQPAAMNAHPQPHGAHPRPQFAVAAGTQGGQLLAGPPPQAMQPALLPPAATSGRAQQPAPMAAGGLQQTVQSVGPAHSAAWQGTQGRAAAGGATNPSTQMAHTPMHASMSSAATTFSGGARTCAQPAAAQSSGADSVHLANQMQHQPTAMHCSYGGGEPKGHGACAGGSSAPQRGGVVNLLDSSDDEEALLAAMPLPATAGAQGTGGAPPDSHMHAADGEPPPLPDACVHADDGMVWVPEDDMMDASFLSDDEANGAGVAGRAAQPVRHGANRACPSQFGVENCNRAGNESDPLIVSSVKHIVAEYAETRSVKGLVRAALLPSSPKYCLSILWNPQANLVQVQAVFECDNPELYEVDEEGNKFPHGHFRVVGTVRDSSGDIPAVLSHDFLVGQGVTLLCTF